METVQKSDTASLPAGTRVGPWRLEALRGQGCHGAVYRAVRVDQETAGPVALKLALHPEDERFAREVALLSRLRHPAVPRLYDSGSWIHPSGACYPYLVMQWVEGTPLYDWAEQHIPSSRQVLQWIARLARALEAIHSAGGVHRDVKGGNVLVRPEDGEVFLVDFGSSRHEGSSTLTDRPLPPGTPAYRSPEAWRCVWRAAPETRYSPGPADDVFALGVTAYQLITSRYPPSTHPEDAESIIWHHAVVPPRAPDILNGHCHPELSHLVLRMLSARPEARGGAGQLAEALEDAALRVGPEAERPLWAPMLIPLPSSTEIPAVPAPPPRPPSPWSTWLPMLTALLALMLVIGSERRGEGVHLQRSASRPDGGSAGIADAAREESEDSRSGLPPGERIAQQPPPKPLPGQLAPDATGRCATSNQVSLNGGCWGRMQVKNPKQCQQDGFFEYQGECYVPIIPPRNIPVSGPPAGDAPH